jgi:hypothetical protein
LAQPLVTHADGKKVFYQKLNDEETFHFQKLRVFQSQSHKRSFEILELLLGRNNNIGQEALSA